MHFSKYLANMFLRHVLLSLGKGNISDSNQIQSNQNISTNKTTHITAKSEVSQATAISDRPKAKPKNSRKLQQKQVQMGATVSYNTKYHNIGLSILIFN
jgi:hypothetical protein